MNALMSLLGSLLDAAGAPIALSLVARWTVLLGLGWIVHAALRGKNPRWKVALWRAVAVGVVAVAILASVPPVVRWPLPGAVPAVASNVINTTATVTVAASPEDRLPASSSSSPAELEATRGVAKSLDEPGHAAGGRVSERSAPAAAFHASSLFRIGPWLLGLWGTGVLLLAARYLWQVRTLSALIGRSTPVPPGVVREWSPAANRPAIPVLRSAEVSTPCLARAWRPVLLLPERSGSEYDPAEMRAILAHELAHARGHDLAWNDALHLVSLVLWFHPLVWRVRQAHASACDAVCDAVAADELGDVASYSQALARIALRAAGPPLRSGLAMARVADVRRRIELLHRRVFHSPLSRRLSLLAALACSLCVLLVGSLGFTRVDQQGSTNPQALNQDTTKRAPAVEVRAKAEATPPAALLTASGTVVDASGKPVAGAAVILREWSVYRVRGMTPKETEPLIQGAELPDSLAETKTDASGNFTFERVPAPRFPQTPEAGQSVFPWDVVALAPGHGLAWVQLTPQRQRTPIVLTLGGEGTVRGRLVEPGGRPVAGAKVKVFGIDPLGRPVDNGLGTDNRLNLIWSAFPLGATTDADGQFTIPGLPRDRIVTLVVTGGGHERLVAFAATTDAPQPENVSRLFRSGQAEETRQPVHTGTFTLTARRADHVLTGRVVLEGDSKPAAGARVLHHARVITADDQGRYRIEGLTSGPLELHASAAGSDAAPVDVTIEIPEDPREHQHDLILPRGLVVTGRVIDQATGRGVEKATVGFTPKPEEGRKPTLFGFRKETDADGRYRLAVPPGRGTLTLESVPPAFPPLPRRSIGQAADPRFAREVEGQGGQTVAVADFPLTRAPGVVVRVVDPADRPLPGARVELRDINRWPRSEPGRTDAQGQYELVGLAPGQVTVLDITADNPPLGATVEVNAEDGRREPKSMVVRLEPLVMLSGRVLDEDGRPLAGPVIRLFRNVMYPGQSSRSFGVAVDTRNEVTADGTYTFDRLIPGATYNTQVEADGYPSASSEHVKIKPGQPVRLDDFRLPLVDQTVGGVVVDARGRTLSGVTVSYQSVDRTRALYAPTGSVWFQETDASGRFQLTGLPRGRIRLMAYRRPEGPDRSIRDFKYMDVPAGQAEVRIELPDPNDRLRGID